MSNNTNIAKLAILKSPKVYNLRVSKNDIVVVKDGESDKSHLIWYDRYFKSGDELLPVYRDLVLPKKLFHSIYKIKS